MSQHEVDLLLLAEVGEPVPGEHAFGGYYQVLLIGFDEPKKRLRRRGNSTVHQDLSGLVQNAHVHRPRVQVNPAVELMLLRVEIHDGLLALTVDEVGPQHVGTSVTSP